MFEIIYNDEYRRQSLSKYTGIIDSYDSEKIIKNHKNWFNIPIEEVIEIKEIIKKIFNLDNNINLLGTIYKDALVMHIDSKHYLNNIHYCIKIINNKIIEAYLLKGTIEIFLDDDENFFDFIENCMIDGINTQNIYS